MEASVVRGVEISVETGLEVRMLGLLGIRRNGDLVELPASRKVRALLAYLALAPHPVTRGQLCDLLWDLPNDPRGELRWCLSKLRGILDEDGRRRIQTLGDSVRLDLTDCHVDAVEIAKAVQTIDTLDAPQLRKLAALFAGEFLEGLEIEQAPGFNGWLTAQRRRFRGCHTALLQHLVAIVDDGEAMEYLERWLELSPYDVCVHELMLKALVRRERIPEAEAHLTAACRMFESEGLETTPLTNAWQAAKHVPAVTVLPTSGGQGAMWTAACRASLAVMPFVDLSTVTGPRGGAADALAHDIITRLAKLRSLFIIAQGTVFALHERGIGPEEAGRMLNVDYVASGSIRSRGDSLTVTIELTETRTARIIWADVFDQKRDDAFAIMDGIADSIVASIAAEIEILERNRAILLPPGSLDAWEAHHRGLWHMYRFNKMDNDRAQHFFEMAVRLDPTFARAYAGLSFTHFQNVFQGWAERQAETDRALETAGQSVMADDRDPAAHWAMGRALWLQRLHEQAVGELQQSIDLSPNFALAHYTLGFVHSQAGNPDAAILSSDLSRRLSPFDPMLFGMLGARAMALVRVGRFDEAAEYGIQAAARPNAHAHILAIAAFSLALAGRIDEGRAYIATIRKTLPGYGIENFVNAMHFDREGNDLFRHAAKVLGL